MTPSDPGRRLKLRQIALVAQELAPVEAAICDVLGVEVCFRDPGVAHFGLENALFPIGDQFLEVVAPIQPGTAGGRYLERRGGDGGYMVITQCDDHAPRRARVEALGVRVVHQYANEEYINMQLHPKDTGGTFFEIDQQLNATGYKADEPWEPAGPGWLAHRRRDARVTAIQAADVQCDDPADVARRWSEIAERELRETTNGRFAFDFDNAEMRFSACSDGRPEGLGAITLACSDPEGIRLAATRNPQATLDGDTLLLAGIRMQLG